MQEPLIQFLDDREWLIIDVLVCLLKKCYLRTNCEYITQLFQTQFIQVYIKFWNLYAY